MKKIPRLLSKMVANFIPGKTLFRGKTPAFLPFYHVVSNHNLLHIKNYPFRNVNQFERELDYFLKYFKPVTLQEIKEQHTKRNIFHLSFDDGLKECAEIVAPLLLKKGIPATFFVNTAFVGNRQLFHKYKASLLVTEMQQTQDKFAARFLKENNTNENQLLSLSFQQQNILDELAEILHLNFADFLAKQQPYLSLAQLKDLQNMGFSIGAHSENHTEFWEISKEEQFKQVKKSVEWVAKNVQPELNVFSFPFTDDGVSEQLIQRLFDENICDLTFGTAGLKYDKIPGHFQRYPVEIPGDFKPNVKAEFVYFYLRKWINKATVLH